MAFDNVIQLHKPHLATIPREYDLCEQIQSSPPGSKVHGANMGPIWGRQDPGGPHVGPMNFAIWVHPYPLYK